MYDDGGRPAKPGGRHCVWSVRYRCAKLYLGEGVAENVNGYRNQYAEGDNSSNYLAIAHRSIGV